MRQKKKYGCDRCANRRVCVTYIAIREALLMSPCVRMLGGGMTNPFWDEMKELIAHTCYYGTGMSRCVVVGCRTDRKENSAVCAYHERNIPR